MIQSSVPKNPLLPILECFLLEAKGSSLLISTSDLHLTCETFVEIDGDKDGQIAVPAMILMGVLSKLGDEALTFSVNTETYITTIKSDRGVYKISSENAKDFPSHPEKINSPSIIPVSEFLEGLVKTAYAVSTDDLRPALSGVYCNNGGALTLVATDGHRLAKYHRSDVKVDYDKSVILSRKLVKMLISILGSRDPEDTLKLSFTGTNLIFIELPDVTIISSLVDERFPDYQNVIPDGAESSLVIDRATFRDAVERIKVFTNKATNQMRIKITGKSIKLIAEDLDYANNAIEEMKYVSYSGEDKELGFNAGFLLDAAKTITTKDLELQLNRPSEAVIIKPVGETASDVLALVMPIML